MAGSASWCIDKAGMLDLSNRGLRGRNCTQGQSDLGWLFSEDGKTLDALKNR